MPTALPGARVDLTTTPGMSDSSSSRRSSGALATTSPLSSPPSVRRATLSRRWELLCEADLAVAALDHRDRHRAGADVLRRQIGLGQEIALRVVVSGDPGGERAQLGEGQPAARGEAAGGDQGLFGKQGLPGHVQHVHLDGGAGRAGLGLDGAGLDAEDRGRRRPRRLRRNLPDLRARIGRLLREGARARSQQSGGEKQAFRHGNLGSPRRKACLRRSVQRKPIVGDGTGRPICAAGCAGRDKSRWRNSPSPRPAIQWDWAGIVNIW